MSAARVLCALLNAACWVVGRAQEPADRLHYELEIQPGGAWSLLPHHGDGRRA